MTSAGTQREARSTLPDEGVVPSGDAWTSLPAFLSVRLAYADLLSEGGLRSVVHSQLRKAHRIQSARRAVHISTLRALLGGSRSRAPKLSITRLHKNVLSYFATRRAGCRAASRGFWKAIFKATFAAVHKTDSLESVLESFLSKSVRKFTRGQHDMVAGTAPHASNSMTILSPGLDLPRARWLQGPYATVMRVALAD